MSSVDNATPLAEKIMVIPLVRVLQKGNTGEYQDCLALWPFVALIRGPA
jgi:hypothetical protein